MSHVVNGAQIMVTEADMQDILDGANCVESGPIDALLDDLNAQQASGTWGPTAPRAAHGSAAAAAPPQLNAQGAMGAGRAFCWDTNFVFALTNMATPPGTAYDEARHRHAVSRCAHADPSNVRWWLFPMLVNSHWALAVVDPGLETVHYYDALRFGEAVDAYGAPNLQAATDAQLQRLGWWWDYAMGPDAISWVAGGDLLPPAGAPPAPRTWAIVRHGAGVPQQADGTSCGAYVAMYARSILSGQTWITTGDASVRQWMHEAVTSLQHIDLLDDSDAD